MSLLQSVSTVFAVGIVLGALASVLALTFGRRD